MESWKKVSRVVHLASASGLRKTEAGMGRVKASVPSRRCSAAAVRRTAGCASGAAPQMWRLWGMSVPTSTACTATLTLRAGGEGMRQGLGAWRGTQRARLGPGGSWER